LLFGDDVVHCFGRAAADAVEPDVAIRALHLMLAEITPLDISRPVSRSPSRFSPLEAALGHG
jgi:hypothetical protein